MSHSSSVESSPSSTLHPRLQAALGSLEVELDDELTRYRRLQGRRPIPPEPPERRDRPAPGVVAAAYPALHSGAAGQEQARLRVVPPQPVEETNAPEPPPLVPLPLDTAQAASGFDEPIPDDYLASSEELLRSLSDDEADLRAEQEPGLLQTLLTPLGVGSMLLLLLSSVTFGYLFTNPNNMKLLGLEKLLRTPEPEAGAIATDPANSSDQTGAVEPSAISPNLSQNEFPDLTLGTLSTLPAVQPLPSPIPTTAPSPVTGGAVPPVVAVSPNPAPQTAAPRPSSRTSSAATTSPPRPAAPAPQRASAPAPRPAASPAPRPAAPRPVASSTPAPRPVAASPASAQPAATAASTPVAAAAPPREDLYYVVTDYTGDRSLDEARQAVDDAYVRNLPNRAVVQMGAFSEPNRAQELQQELEQQGIPAQIYQP